MSFFLLNAGIDFPTPPTPSPTTFIALKTINKLQENYFSTVSQCLPYLTATAVTHPNAPIWDVYGWKYYCCVLQWLKNIIILFCEFNSLLLFGFSMFFMFGDLPNIPKQILVSLFQIVSLPVSLYPKEKLNFRWERINLSFPICSWDSDV